VETEIKRTYGKGEWFSDHGAFREALLPDDVKIDPDENCKSRWPWKEGTAPPCTYTIGSSATMSLANMFWSFWNGTVAGLKYSTAVPSNDVLDILYGGGVTNFTHIDNVLRGISDSMTAAIRLTGMVKDTDSGQGGGQGNITGQVLLADTCIDVRWTWIALPVAVSLLTLVLLIWTILLDTAMRDRSGWKSSALPVLFHGLDSSNVTTRDHLHSMKEMEVEAKGMWVRLDKSVDGELRLEPCR